MQRNEGIEISVIIPTHNCAQYLFKSVESLKNQNTKRAVEIIVVDDGSDQLNRYGNHAVAEIFDVEYLPYSPHANANVARNFGYKMSSGSYLVFADSDCVYGPDFLETLRTALDEHPSAPYAYSNFQFTGKMEHVHISREYSSERIRERNFIDTSAMIRRPCFPGFDPTVRRLQDWDLWLTIDESDDRWGWPHWVNATLYENHVRNDSVSVTENYEKALKKIQHKHNLL